MRKLLLVLTVLCAVSPITQAAPKAENFNVRLTGVAVAKAEGDDEAVTPLPPETRIVVTPGNLAIFFLEYDVPADLKTLLFLGANYPKADTSENPFGSSGSATYSGKGKLQRILILMPESYGKPLLLKSVRITGEIEAAKGAPRNDSFFICDAAVNVLFAKEKDKTATEVTLLEPRPAPAPDPTLGIKPPDKTDKGTRQGQGGGQVGLRLFLRQRLVRMVHEAGEGGLLANRLPRRHQKRLRSRLHRCPTRQKPPFRTRAARESETHREIPDRRLSHGTHS